MNQRELSLRIAWSHLGRPYIWGGSNPAIGFDCSGFIIECGMSSGWFPAGHDLTAQGIRDRYPAVAIPAAGDLVFWLKNDKAYHVGMVIETGTHYIGADGGGSGMDTVAEAIAADARIKVRPLSIRGATPQAYVSPYLN